MYSDPRVSCREPISPFSQVDTAPYLHTYSPKKRQTVPREGVHEQQPRTPPLPDRGAPSVPAPQRQSKKSQKSPPPVFSLLPSAYEQVGEDVQEAYVSSPSKQPRQTAESILPHAGDTARYPEEGNPQETLVISAPPKVIPPKSFLPAPTPQPLTKKDEDWGLDHTPSLLAVPPEAYTNAVPRRPVFPVIKLATVSKRDRPPSQQTKLEGSDEEVPLAMVRKAKRPRKTIEESPAKKHVRLLVYILLVPH